tara:strand:- start:13152 stop:13412 length:261 start_codon:yes stop_codon:yes gene_type:complete
MTLENFIKDLVCRNSLIRLWYPNPSDDGHSIVVYDKDWDIVSMEWEALKGEGAFKDYLQHTVVGVSDIYMNKSPYVEAINIVIKKK